MNKLRTGLSVTDCGLVGAAEFRATLAACRTAWASELELPKDTSLHAIARHLASEISETIRRGSESGLDLKALKKKVRNAARIGDAELLCSHSLNGVTCEFLTQSSSDYWTERLVGEMRSALSGLSDRSITKAALERLVINAEGDEKLRTFICGPDGYRRVALLFCQGSMHKAFKLMSAVCKAEELNFKALDWGAKFPGSTAQFRTEAQKPSY